MKSLKQKLLEILDAYSIYPLRGGLPKESGKLADQILKAVEKRLDLTLKEFDDLMEYLRKPILDFYKQGYPHRQHRSKKGRHPRKKNEPK